MPFCSVMLLSTGVSLNRGGVRYETLSLMGCLPCTAWVSLSFVFLCSVGFPCSPSFHIFLFGWWPVVAAHYACVLRILRVSCCCDSFSFSARYVAFFSFGLISLKPYADFVACCLLKLTAERLLPCLFTLILTIFLLLQIMVSLHIFHTCVSAEYWCTLFKMFQE